MDHRPNRVQSSHEGYTWMEWRKFRQEHRAKMRKLQNQEKKTSFDNEGFKIIKAMLLALSILTLCYYGATEYNVLQNGQILCGFPSRKTVVIFRFGYSISHSIISAVGASMLVYSIIMKQPQFSLPFIGFYLAELVCDLCNMVVMIWYLFEYLQIQTALLYTTGLLLLLLTKIWTWQGVVWLYEHRNFKTVDADDKR